jgi:2-polyprenyl-3-methyl-5-hydroxy-6-metoxy-1,4-benzoquinol methylase
MFKKCEICNSKEWSKVIYSGQIRAGAHDSYIPGGMIKKCNVCGVHRLNEPSVLVQKEYESNDYRLKMDQGLSPKEFFNHADPMQINNLESFWPIDFRDKVVADIGCGAGSFVSFISGLAKKIIAVEPTKSYHHSLKEKGYEVFGYTKDALIEHQNSVDIVTSFQVIESMLKIQKYLFKKY